MKNIHRHDKGQDFGLLLFILKYIINLLCFVMKLASIICKLDRFLEILQIVQRNLQIGWPIYQLTDWPGQFANWPDWQIGRNRNIQPVDIFRAGYFSQK